MSSEHECRFCFIITPGEFGLVYKAHLVKFTQQTPEIVAVKTLKGYRDKHMCNTATHTTTHKVQSYGVYKSTFDDTEVTFHSKLAYPSTVFYLWPFFFFQCP